MGLLNKLFGSKKNKKKREGSPDVYYIPNEDERMNWGMEKSRLTLHYFQECIENPKQEQQYFSIKAKIEDGNNTEHIWLMEPSFDNEGNVYGIIGNEPADVKNIAINEKVGIPFNDVSDWMIIEDGRLIGGYTIRAIRDGLTGNDLENFDRNLGGMIVDEGEDHFLSNYDTPEGAILSLEDAYDNDDLEKAINAKNFQKEAEFMLKKTLTIDIDQEIIDKTAEVLELSFKNTMTESGMPKFTNIKRAFRRQMISDNHCMVTEICSYPDGSKSSEKLNTYKSNNEWKVIGIEE